MMPDDKSAVRVAVRVRPLSVREREEFQSTCLTVASAEQQIIIGTERAFTYDFTFSSDTQQQTVFETTTKSLVEGCFKGLNATILAYGQTGSGKTYTMGTGFDLTLPAENMGIIPRAVDHMFQLIHDKEEECHHSQLPAPLYDMSVQFIELYQDEIIDLLDRASRPILPGQKKRPKPPRLGEDKLGNVLLINVRTMPVQSKDEELLTVLPEFVTYCAWLTKSLTERRHPQILNWLKQGALARTTGATNMNAQSSRSHAIFTISIKQSVQSPSDEGDTAPQFLTTSAKFHFVDLAGSERLKRTGATGDRAKESIAINGGLLALGNVICKLGDKTLKATHIPYRSSKLTRLLQDSLGGNSQTMMIACISAAEQDFVETLNTLRYANRTRNIQNKVAVNQDKTGQTLALLRVRCQELEMQVLEYQQGKRQAGVDAYNDMFIENNALQKENETLLGRLKELHEDNMEKQHRNTELRAEIETLKERFGFDIDNAVSNQNLTDGDKIRIHYCARLEELQSVLRKKERELERVQSSSRSPPTSPSKTLINSGSKTYRMQRPKPETPEDVLNDSIIIDEPVAEDQDLIDIDDDLESDIDDIDEKIKEKEEKLKEVMDQLTSQRQNYEAKIEQLSNRIEEVEQERIAYMRDSRTKPGVDIEKIKEREVKYQEELDRLKSKLKETQVLRDENRRLQKDNSVSTAKVAHLEIEIGQLKRIRCEAMKKMDMESKRARQKDLEQTRVLSQKEKESRSVKRQNTELKNELQRSQNIITRLRADLQAARKVQKYGMSDQVAGRVGKHAHFPDETVLKKNWEDFQKNFRAAAYKRVRMKAFAKQLLNYNEEIRNLREQTKVLESRLAVSAERKDMAETENLKRELDDTRSTIHFFQQQTTEVQNDAASCEETPEEYNWMDSTYLLAKFPDESSSRFFLDNMLELCTSQREEIRALELNARTRSDELAIVVKDRDQLRMILQSYIVDSPTQTKIDIAGVGRSPLEQNGIADSKSEEIIRNLMETPRPVWKTSARTKARKITLNGPEEMLVASEPNVSSSSCSASSSSEPDSAASDNVNADTTLVDQTDSSALTELMPAPKLLPSSRIQKDFRRAKLAGLVVHREHPHTGSHEMIVNCTAISANPIKTPNRSSSLNEITEAANVPIIKVHPASGHSLENILPPSSLMKPSPVRRHPCQSHLNLNGKIPVHSAVGARK